MRGKDEGRKIRFNQGDGAVFHFARGVAFRMDIGKLFDFERPFQREGVGLPASKEEHALAFRILPGQGFCFGLHGG